MFATFARQSSQEAYSNERLVNYFLRQIDGVSGAALIGRGGLTALASISNRPRAIVEMAGDLYAVSGNTVWKHDISAGTTSNVGTVSGGEQVSMAASGTEVAIVTSGTYYICDGSSTTTYSTGAVTNPQWVVFIDGYFFVSGTASNRADAVTVSTLDDGTTFNALNFAFAENAPDEIRGLAVLNKRVWVFGARTIEKFWNSGADFPFEVSQTESLDKGILAGTCWAQIDNTICWVGSDKIVYRSGGGTPQVISTPEVKQVLDSSEIEACFAFIDQAHEFFAVRTKSGPTWCYDVTTGLWAERTTGVDYAPWMAVCVAEYNGTQYLGTDTGQICTLSAGVHTDVGEIVSAEAISRPITQGNEFFTVDFVRLRAETGGQFTGTPQIMMQMGKNGFEWGVERWKSLGDIGKYNKRIQWNALGQFEQAQIRLRVTDAVQRDLYGVSYELSR